MSQAGLVRAIGPARPWDGRVAYVTMQIGGVTRVGWRQGRGWLGSALILQTEGRASVAGWWAAAGVGKVTCSYIHVCVCKNKMEQEMYK